MKQSTSNLNRIYRLKVIIVALVSLILGVGLLALSRYVGGRSGWTWLDFFPLSEVGGALTAAGLFGIAWDYVDARDKEAREDERIRRLLKDAAPDFRDAVVQGFAVQPDDLARVASPELLDGIAKNVLGLRLGDKQFASEIYEDIRDQAIRAPERWYDAKVLVRLSPAGERNAGSVPLFEVLMQWEYTVTPTHPTQRFACVSDRDEFREFAADIPSTLPWFMTPRPGVDASSRDCFDLLDYRVNGEERPVRRTARKDGQIYTASIGSDHVKAAQPVRITYLYRVVTPQSGHRLFVEVTQPTRGFSLDFDYTDADIAHASVTDLISSAKRTRVAETPREVDARIISVDLPGWLLPRAGFALVWSLKSEQRGADEPARAAARAKKLART